MMASRTIGALAREAGVNVETIRYYEREGLVRQPPRLGSGWRRYDDEALHTVRFIKRAQALGFSLAEVRQLLALRRVGGERCADVRRTAQAKIAEIDTRIADLRAMRGALAELVRACGARNDELSCPIVESLGA